MNQHMHINLTFKNEIQKIIAEAMKITQAHLNNVSRLGHNSFDENISRTIPIRLQTTRFLLNILEITTRMTLK